MEYISRFESSTIVCHTYCNNILTLSNDEFRKILHTDHHCHMSVADDQFDIISDIRRVLADALVFIYTVYQYKMKKNYKNTLSLDFKTWNSFFDACFVDIICNSNDVSLCGLARRLQQRVDMYSTYYGTYIPFVLNITNTNYLLRDILVVICITILLQ